MESGLEENRKGFSSDKKTQKENRKSKNYKRKNKLQDFIQFGFSFL